MISSGDECVTTSTQGPGVSLSVRGGAPAAVEAEVNVPVEEGIKAVHEEASVDASPEEAEANTSPGEADANDCWGKAVPGISAEASPAAEASAGGST
jgi:hypothetical protein